MLNPLWTWIVLGAAAGVWTYGNWRILRADDRKADR